jgi:hypothetical protein
MHIHHRGTLIASIFPLLFATSVASSQEAALSEVTWDQVKAVFQKRCFACHRGEQSRGGLDLSSVAGIKAGSTSGVAVVSGKPEESMIYSLPAHLENPKMPPNSAKLPQRELDLIYGWIQGGLSEKETMVATSASRPARGVASRPRPVVARNSKPNAVSAMTVKTEMSASLSVNPKASETAPKIVPRMSRVITAMAASPTASLVAMGGHREVLIFQWTDQSLVSTIPYPEGDVFALRFSRDGSILLAGGGVGGASGKVIGFDVATGTSVFEVGSESDIVLAADLSPDGLLVALGGPSRVVRLFDTVTGDQLAEMKKHTDWVLSLAFSNDGLLLASGDRFGSLQIWEAASGDGFLTLRGHTGAINGIVWSADSNTVMSAGEDGTLRSWDMHEGTQRHLLNGEVGGVLAVDSDAFGHFVLGGRNRQLSIWRGMNDRRHRIPMDDQVIKVAMTQDGTHVIAADVTGSALLYNIETGRDVGRFALP